MQRPYRLIAFERDGPVCCARFRQSSFDDESLELLGAELARLVDEEGCRRVVLSLGPGELTCLYSILLAKLINLQRRLESHGGGLALAQLSEHTHEMFALAGLDKFFRFYPDRPAAVQALSATQVAG
jgi:anti-anti-sigma regulatory factor